MFRAIFMASLILAFPVQAEVFRCQNGDGKTIYQQAPCVGGAATGISDHPEPVNPAVEARLEELRQWNREESAHNTAREIERIRNCMAARRDAEDASQYHYIGLGLGAEAKAKMDRWCN